MTRQLDSLSEETYKAIELTTELTARPIHADVTCPTNSTLICGRLHLGYVTQYYISSECWGNKTLYKNKYLHNYVKWKFLFTENICLIILSVVQKKKGQKKEGQTEKW